MTLNFKFVLVSLVEILLKPTSWGRILFHLSLFDFSPIPLPVIKDILSDFSPDLPFLLHLLDFCSFL